ncbi:MAG: LPS export ABC transporter periplasmic protein LptC [Chitinophagaceae bacterium]|nr:LPS export ABC transporter periplasmic protein LptC [Chitinophagaceae bacterium]
MIKKKIDTSLIFSWHHRCVAILLSAVLLFSFTSCENDEAEVKNLSAKSLGVEEATNVKVNYTTGGKAKAQLFSPLMLRVQDTTSYVEFPKTLHVDFYNEAGVIESILDAKYGKYNEQQSKVLLKDSVRFIGLKNGDTLYTNELYWDRNRPTYQFYTDKPVRVLTKAQIINSIGFEVSQDFKDKWFKNTTNSIFRVPTSQFPEY